MDLINKTVYINLDKRQDRDIELLAEFNKLNFTNFSRFSAIETSFGGIGCCLSHLAILQQFKDEQIAVGMIVEDDAIFTVDRTAIDEHINAFIADPLAEVLCLGFCLMDAEPYTNIFDRSLKSTTTSCYLVKYSMLDDLMNCFKESAKMMQMDPNNDLDYYHYYAIDQYWECLQKQRLFVVPKYHIVKQRHGYSDVAKKIIARDV